MVVKKRHVWFIQLAGTKRWNPYIRGLAIVLKDVSGKSDAIH